jgi:hypothetical protein
VFSAMRARTRSAGVLLCALVCVALCACPARARAAAPSCAPLGAQERAVDPAEILLAETEHWGVIDLYFEPSIGVPVTFFECVRDRAHRVGSALPGDAGVTWIPGAVPWVCERSVRHFVATATDQAGQLVRRVTSARTPDCAHRFGFSAMQKVRRGRTAAVQVIDTWRIGGLRVRLCITSPAGARRCRRLAFAPSVSIRTVHFRAGERGRWKLDLKVRRFHVRSQVAVGVKPVPTPPRPVLLAAGDSTMNGVASGLSDDLGEFNVFTAVSLGAEISLHDWPEIARTHVVGLNPAVVVVSVGATEGFPMTSPDGVRHVCCGADWVAEYVRRVRATMQNYRLGGARVYFETIALSRDPAHAAIVKICNAAVVTAARGLPGVTVLRMDLLFTPHGYQETIRDGGRDVPIREDDGIHLNASGTAIEARETAKAIRGQPTIVPEVRG